MRNLLARDSCEDPGKKGKGKGKKKGDTVSRGRERRRPSARTPLHAAKSPCVEMERETGWREGGREGEREERRRGKRLAPRKRHGWEASEERAKTPCGARIRFQRAMCTADAISALCEEGLSTIAAAVHQWFPNGPRNGRVRERRKENLWRATHGWSWASCGCLGGRDEERKRAGFTAPRRSGAAAREIPREKQRTLSLSYLG